MTAGTRHVLLIDDDPSLVTFLGDRFRREGYRVSTALSGAEAMAQIGKDWPDLVVLDLMLPGMDGEEIARLIKDRADIPVIILSAVSASESKVEFISRYAEDYVTKPFHYPELRARMQRVLGRMQGRVPVPELVLGPDLTLFLPRRRAQVAGEARALSPIETRLLAALAGRMGETVTTDELLADVWNEADSPEPVYVWVTVRRLRRKIEIEPERPRHLLSGAAGGYRLVASTSPGRPPV